jgi:hypothetical protein
VPIREFNDAAGVHWKVWSTVPYALGVMDTLRSGWLTFESTSGRRRLAPIPADWEGVSDSRLNDYCDAANHVQLTPITGTFKIAPRDLEP